MKETMSKREISLERAAELKSKISDYLEARENIPRGMDEMSTARFKARKARILDYFNATEDDWNDWEWQLEHRISDVDTLAELSNLDEDELEDVRRVGSKYRWAVSPYLYVAYK